jgi:hypothetical protein
LQFRRRQLPELTYLSTEYLLSPKNHITADERDAGSIGNRNFVAQPVAYCNDGVATPSNEDDVVRIKKDVRRAFQHLAATLHAFDRDRPISASLEVRDRHPRRGARAKGATDQDREAFGLIVFFFPRAQFPSQFLGLSP